MVQRSPLPPMVIFRTIRPLPHENKHYILYIYIYIYISCFFFSGCAFLLRDPRYGWVSFRFPFQNPNTWGGMVVPSLNKTATHASLQKDAPDASRWSYPKASSSTGKSCETRDHVQPRTRATSRAARGRELRRPYGRARLAAKI